MRPRHVTFEIGVHPLFGQHCGQTGNDATRSFLPCCARAASGQVAAALPSSVMNSRAASWGIPQGQRSRAKYSRSSGPCIAAKAGRSFPVGVKPGHGGDVCYMTALPPKADVRPRSCYVAEVPFRTHALQFAATSARSPKRQGPERHRIEDRGDGTVAAEGASLAPSFNSDCLLSRSLRRTDFWQSQEALGRVRPQAEEAAPVTRK